MTVASGPWDIELSLLEGLLKWQPDDDGRGVLSPVGRSRRSRPPDFSVLLARSMQAWDVQLDGLWVSTGLGR